MTNILTDKATLSPLPSVLRHGLAGVTALAFLSFFTSLTLFLLLSWRLIVWNRKKVPYNQFVLLIWNLVLADIQQSLAFLLNASWLIRNEITVGSSTCWAQGWFVSTGDLASGVWCVTIGLHTFASVVFNYKVSNKTFFIMVGLLWSFVYAMAILCVLLHPHDIFVRAGAWCWVNSAYPELRLWTHYFFIFTTEFGTIIIYTLMYLILTSRIKIGNLSQETTEQARQAAKLMVVYPLVYVVCTLPLASARMAGMTGNSPSFVHLCVAAAMITSNGWLDVLLYTMTRRIMLFSDNPPDDAAGISTFVPFWGASHQRFGTTTTISAGLHHNTSAHGRKRSLGRPLRSESRLSGRLGSRSASRQSSTEELFTTAKMAEGIVKTRTTVEVHSEPLHVADVMELKQMAYRARAPSAKEDSVSLDGKSLTFETEPSDYSDHQDHRQQRR